MAMISQTSRYAFRALSYLSGPEGAYQSVEALALLSEAPGPYLSKLMQLLHKSGIVDSIRGQRGGLPLRMPLAQQARMGLSFFSSPRRDPRSPRGMFLLPLMWPEA